MTALPIEMYCFILKTQETYLKSRGTVPLKDQFRNN
jgi:hypothetical protein